MARYDDYDDGDSGPDLPIGEVRDAVALDLAALITSHPMAEGLRAMALHLAGSLDYADHQSRAGLARELRAVLNDLAGLGTTSAEADLDALLSTPTAPGAPPAPAEEEGPDDAGD